MRLQIASPAEHRALFNLPWSTPLRDWTLPDLNDPGGIHRHEVRVLVIGDITYVIKELPEDLAEREYRLLRELQTLGVPTATALGVVFDRGVENNGEGCLITRHIDFALPYRVLLAGRGLKIPFLGDRVLDALVGLLVRLHLSGFFWGDCSLGNTLFRRDAGALVAFVIDVETAELHPTLTDGQRHFDVQLAVENIAGGLLDLQAAGYLADGIDPIETAGQVEHRYTALWAELTGVEELSLDNEAQLDARLKRLHDLGFDVGEVEVVGAGSDRVRLIPRVVELGYFAPRLAQLTGLDAGENQARRLLDDIRRHGAIWERERGRRLPETVVAARWLDTVYEPLIEAVPEELSERLEPAEVYHQVLEHRWFLSERARKDVGLHTALRSYLDTVLRAAPDEYVVLDPPTAELRLGDLLSSDPPG